MHMNIYETVNVVDISLPLKLISIFIGIVVYFTFPYPFIHEQTSICQVDQWEVGVIDRIDESGYVTILIENLKKEVIIKEEELPGNARVHMWLHLYKCEEMYVVHSINLEKTEQQLELTRQLQKQITKQ